MTTLLDRTVVLGALQSEFILRRAEGAEPAAALRAMFTWRAEAYARLEGVPGVWPRRIVGEMSRLGSELARLRATVHMAELAALQPSPMATPPPPRIERAA